MAREIFKLHGVVSADGLEGVKGALLDLEGVLKNADKAFAQFGRQATRVGSTFSKFFTAPIVAVGAAVALATNKTLGYAEEMVKLNDVTGLSMDTLQEFKHVANMTGTDFETITGSIQKFARELPQIAKEGGPASDMLKKLGVNVFDASGNVRNINELFPEMLKKIQAIPDPMTRLSVAQQIFGRSAGDLGPILKMTSEQLDAMRKEAHDLGIVIDNESIKAAEAFGDEVGKLKSQAGAMVMKLASEFIPILRNDLLPLIQAQVIPAVQGFAEKIKGVIEWFKGLDDSTKKIIMGIVGFTAVLGPFLLIFGKTILAVKELTIAANLLKVAFLTNPFGVAILGATALVGVLTTLEGMYKKREQQKLDAAKSKAVTKELQDFIKLRQEQEEIIKTGEASHFQLYSRESVEQAKRNIEDIKKAVIAFKREAGLATPETPEAPKAAPQSSFSFDSAKEKKNKPFTPSVDTMGTESVEKKLSDAALKEQQIAAEKYIALGQIEDEFFKEQEEKNKAAQDRNNERIRMQNETEASMRQQALNSMVDNMGVVASKYKAFGGIYKRMAQAQAIIDTYKGATSAYASLAAIPVVGPALGVAAAAAAIGAGLVRVAMIEAQQFAAGAFVKGGKGGVLAQVGEREDDELVLPMRKGTDIIAESILKQINAAFPTATPAYATAGIQNLRPLELHIGTLVADDYGLMELERRLEPLRLLEMNRRGYNG